ncbi:MAG TPA: anti-sigma factor [Chitinophagaceae bacterium]
MATPTQIAYRKSLSKRRVILFSIVVLMACIPATYFLFIKSNELREELRQYQQAGEQTQKEQGEDYTPKNNWLQESIIIKQWSVPVSQQDKPVTIKLYLHTGSNMLLLINSLSKLPEDQKYQVWSLIKGERKSLGLFDAPSDDRLIIDIGDDAMADGFEITVVKGQ